MAITLTSLKNLSVPNASGNANLLMPKLKYRFRVILENFGNVVGASTDLTKQVVTAARPQVQFENQVIHVYNSQINYAGKHTWQPMNLVVRDAVDNSVSRLVNSQLQKQVDFFEQASAASGGDYKFVTVIQVLDGGNGDTDTPNILEQWECLGCYLQTVNFNEMTYAESAPMEIALTIQFDNALCVDGKDAAIGAGVGAALGQSTGQLATALATGQFSV
jgi:hypothetical protein